MHDVKRRVPLLVGAALLVGGASIPAQAVDTAPHTVRVVKGQGKEACSWGVVCLYENADRNKGANAPMLLTNQNIPRLGKYAFDNKAGSVCNHTTRPVRVYERAGYKGPSETVKPAGCKNVRASFDNKASSLRFTS
ncbi:peptidase inhibitor family I36 protein [Streptomyces smyrnaeus]|uniref:peptidase inhibitor family I36 protein n=1 Tax=Streptomyces smyrnaeus TaxID=1387713 RepID=UPI0034007BBE